MTAIPPNLLRELTDALTNLWVEIEGAPFDKFFKDLKLVKNHLKEIADTDVMKEGAKALNSLTKAMDQMNHLQQRALASNKNLTDVISQDLVTASFSMGTSFSELAETALELNEAGISKLDKSTMLLAGRMRATGQDVGALSKFIGVNNSLLMMSQTDSQQLAANLSTYSQKLGATQESILKMSESLAKNFELQAAMAGPGLGGGLPAAFATLGARLGGKADQQVAMISQIFGKGNLSQLIQLGISEGFQESLMAERDPAKQQAMMDQMIRTAAAAVQTRIGGLGNTAAGTRIASQTLGSMGGENVLAFKQLASMLGDARQPINELSDSLTTFNSLAKAFAMPMEYLGAALLKFLNLPIVGTLAKGLAAFAGVAAMLATSITLFASAVSLFRLAVIKQVAAAHWAAIKMFAAATMNVLAAMMTNPLLAIVAGGIVGGIAYWQMMAEDVKDLNNKTPDPRDKANAGLTGQIFSQLVNIVTSTNTNYLQREMLATQKELVRLAKRQNDLEDPNNSPVSKPPVRKIAGGAAL